MEKCAWCHEENEILHLVTKTVKYELGSIKMNRQKYSNKFCTDCTNDLTYGKTYTGEWK